MSVAAPDEQLRSQATTLAEELNLPLVVEDAAGFDLLLVVTEHGLELRETGCGAAGPLKVQFGGAGATAHRLATTSPREPLASAIGLAKGRPTVLDATAGLGRDAMVLAVLGCKVTAVDRCAVLGVMLRDALQRAATNPELKQVIRDRIRLVVRDAREVLAGTSGEEAPEVVYLDPMYSPRKKSALPKKEMRLLRRLVGDDPDAGALPESARRVARARVGGTRTPRAPPLAPTPTMSYKGKIARYDVYLTPRGGTRL